MLPIKRLINNFIRLKLLMIQYKIQVLKYKAFGIPPKKSYESFISKQRRKTPKHTNHFLSESIHNLTNSI